MKSQLKQTLVEGSLEFQPNELQSNLLHRCAQQASPAQNLQPVMQKIIRLQFSFKINIESL
jgi:hypothetical protein